MQTLSLVEPNLDFQQTYASYVEEFRDRHETLVPFVIGIPYEAFEDYVAELLGYSQGVGIAEGWVSHSTFWLIDRNREIVAVSNVRHSLTPNLMREGGHIGYSVRPSRRGEGLGTAVLRESLQKARDLGLERVLITCGKENLRSARVIQRNHGQFDSEEFLEEREETVQRYWIDL